MASPRESSLRRVADRVQAIAEDYDPPDFAEVPTPDAALFLTAIDHGTGYETAHLVDGKGPYEGSALLWALGLRAERSVPGALTARSLQGVDPGAISAVFRADQDTLRDPEGRAKLWDDLATRLLRSYDGQAAELLAAANGRLGGAGGLLARLSDFEAYADPLQKKSFLVAKVWERRGWLEVADPESWEVCADNVLMRLALRSGLVEPSADVDQVRAGTRDAFGEVARAAGISPPLLDDLLWELGREDPDLLGTDAGDLSEPPRRPGIHFY